MPSTTNRSDALKAAHDRLTRAVESIVSGDDWMRMLKVSAKFHKYSFQNQLLIYSQRPDATLVAGFNRWKSLGRFVRKGEKGIAILAPVKYRVRLDEMGEDCGSDLGRRGRSSERGECTAKPPSEARQRGDRPKTEPKGEKGIAIFAPCKYKVDPSSDGPAAASLDGKGKCGSDLDSGSSASAVEVAAPSAAGAQRSRRAHARQRGDRPKTEVIRGFRVVHVFDISQTEGEELPDLDAVRPKLLDGAAPEGIWDALAGHATSIGYEVVRGRRGSENGYCDFLNKEIGVRPDVSTAQAVKTLIHELGHALLHAEGPVRSRDIAEVEVESVAFIVCDALGVDTGDYSFPYVARWSGGELETIKETGARVVAYASRILTVLELPEANRVGGNQNAAEMRPRLLGAAAAED